MSIRAWAGKWVEHGCAALMLGAACTRLVAATPGMDVRHDVVFTMYSPLAATQVLLERVIAPVMLQRIRAEAAASGKAIAEQPIDLADERFSLYVPTVPAPDAGFGLLVFVPPWDQAGIPRAWIPVLAQRRLIAVVAAKSGNEANVIARRMPLALSAYQNVVAQFKIDPARVYVGGFSGGSRVALRIALAFPDVFRGALLNSSSYPIGTSLVPIPPRPLFKQFVDRSRLVYATGSEDPAALATDRSSRSSARDLCFSDIETFSMRGSAHVPADPATFGRAIDSLDSARKLDADTETCLAALEHKIGGRLDGVQKLLDTGDRKAAAEQLEAVDADFGGLATPRSLELARKIQTVAANSQ